MTRTGKVTIKLTDAILLPSDFEKLVKVNNSVIYDVFTFKVGQNKLEWKPLEYSVREHKNKRMNFLHKDITETYKIKVLKV